MAVLGFVSLATAFALDYRLLIAARILTGLDLGGRFFRI